MKIVRKIKRSLKGLGHGVECTMLAALLLLESVLPALAAPAAEQLDIVGVAIALEDYHIH